MLMPMTPTARIILVVVFIILCVTIKIVNQYERKVLFTLGKYTGILKPGLNFVVPFIQTTMTVDVREKAVDVPSQEAMTKDNISCTINAVIYYKIREDEANKSVINVRYLDYAMSQFAQTTMRNIVGQFELDELLAKREEASHKIKAIVDEKSDVRGVEVMSVELKDINIPVDLQRTIGKQAEAEREKRAKIITSEGELASAQNLQEAAELLAKTPGALHLRTLQSINDISSDQSNTTVRMIPVEILEAIKGFGAAMTKK
jgi:regulator of protease activity HflC (stomatin/prohibitin superfamily)